MEPEIVSSGRVTVGKALVSVGRLVELRVPQSRNHWVLSLNSQVLQDIAVITAECRLGSVRAAFARQQLCTILRTAPRSGFLLK